MVGVSTQALSATHTHSVLSRIPWTYLVRRASVVIPICVGVSAITFLLMRLVPGDPAAVMLGEHAGDPVQLEQMRERLGLNRPLMVQYSQFVLHALQGDLGNSLRTNRPVREDLLGFFPATIELAAGGMFFAVVLGLVSGILSGFSRSRTVDTVSMVIALIGVSMPIFWLGLQLVSWFSVGLDMFPISGRRSLLISRPEVVTGRLWMPHSIRRVLN